MAPYEAWFASVIGALVGGWVAYWFSLRKLAVERKSEFIKRQLSELYSPLAATQKRIRGKSELRLRIFRELDKMDEGPPRFEAKQTAINYANKQLAEELIPLYQTVLDVFTEKYWLAEADTRSFYPRFLEYVEFWNKPSIPPEVGEAIGHDEGLLEPFYHHVETKLTDLQNQIKDKYFWRQTRFRSLFRWSVQHGPVWSRATQSGITKIYKSVV
jgi:hypothetical protein